MYQRVLPVLLDLDTVRFELFAPENPAIAEVFDVARLDLPVVDGILPVDERQGGFLIIGNGLNRCDSHETSPSFCARWPEADRLPFL